jgi:hypothetical protein
MAFGLPVIAADTAVNRELCGEAASYFPADDSAMLAELLVSYYWTAGPGEVGQRRVGAKGGRVQLGVGRGGYAGRSRRDGHR